MDAPSPHPIRVLLADDHAVVRAGIRQFLEFSGGIEVVAECSDGCEAIQQSEQLRPDVLVLDIRMPGLSGIDVCRTIRQQVATRPEDTPGILILTAYDDEPYIQAVLRAGANGYVLKTANPMDIVQAVRDVYAGRVVLDAALAVRLLRKDSTLEAPVEPLTEREGSVLALVARGLTNKAIGVHLSISNRTVQNHLSNIFAKLNASSRTEAVMRAISLGILTAPDQPVP